MANLTSNAIARADEYCEKGFPCKDCGDPIEGVRLGFMLEKISALVEADAGGPQFKDGAFVPRGKTLRHGDGIVHTDDLFRYTPRLRHEDFGKVCTSVPCTFTITHVAVTCPYCGAVNMGLTVSTFRNRQQGKCTRGCGRPFIVPRVTLRNVKLPD
jgi:hypothetical protein